ncbi:MAG: transcriptional regulator [Candidatus Aenigmarchaeota archaeon]|nr:transcriptional regulator [Candidatus Aenigmarchaeota archaeon]
MIWDDVGFIVKSEKRKNLLLLLEKPRTPTQLSKAMRSSLANVSLKLKDLSDKGIIKCVNPESKKGRIYMLTENGKKTLEKIKEMES